MARASSPVIVTLKKDLARSIRRGHPWVYRDALAGGDGLENGALVSVQTRDGRTLARGFWDSASPIAVRVLESGGPGHRFTDPGLLIEERLREALDRRLAVLDLTKTNAFRWVHGEADLLPGIHVDFYADTAVVRFDGEGARAFYEHLEARLHEAAGARLQLRSVLDRDARDPRAEFDEREVLENGVRFVVDLAHAQKGGLFLDQRDNRQTVAERARDASVLNLFGYTGGFSLHAAVAGASSTDTVDIARSVIEAARRNFEANHLSLDHARFHVADAFAFLNAAAERGERWDIVISDPPSFARSKSSVPAALQAYRRLHSLTAAVTRPGGLLCASSCSTHVSKDDFVRTIEAGARMAGRSWDIESLSGAAFDHPSLPAFPEGDYLKFAIGRCL
jgi:23S rRNA (cytosine1962-C5)-methyltransferase